MKVTVDLGLDWLTVTMLVREGRAPLVLVEGGSMWTKELRPGEARVFAAALVEAAAEVERLQMPRGPW
jgi:hypothetical protein